MTNSGASTRRAKVVTELFSEYKSSNRWAVIIGISEYQHPSWNLRYADRDAEEFYKLLKTPNGGGFKSEHICKLTNTDATTRNITQALRSFLQKPAREDLVIVYFACHGAPDLNRPDNIYLLTHDTDPSDIAGTGLPMREVDLALNENLHAEKVVVIADTCHSAAIGGGIGRRSASDETALVNRYLREVSQSKDGMALLTSAEANEASFEDQKWGGGHGVFTYFLLEGMRGAADRDQDGIVSVGELFEYVRDRVKEETDHKQHPSIGTSIFDRNLPISINSSMGEMSFPEESIRTPSFSPTKNDSSTYRVYPEAKSTISIFSKLPRVLMIACFALLIPAVSVPAIFWLRAQDDSTPQEIGLADGRNISLEDLESFLRDKNFQNANSETRRLLFEIADIQDQTHFNLGDVEKLDCRGLNAIDKLWLKYSDGKFGISTQRHIFIDLEQDWARFVDEVGWVRKEGDFLSKHLRYDLDAPTGHLPGVYFWQGQYSKFYPHLPCNL